MNKALLLFQVLFFGALLSGCGTSGAKDPKYSIESGLKEQSAIIIGKICENSYIGFEKEGSSDQIIHHGDLSGLNSHRTPDYAQFALRLPAGRYSLAELGSPVGKPFRSSNPYTFEVSAGEVVYIGTIIPSWSNVSSSTGNYCPKEIANKEIVSMKKYQSKRLMRSSVYDFEVYLANDFEEAKKSVKARYPEIDLSGAVIRLMR